MIVHGLIMAFRATGWWRAMAASIGCSRQLSTSTVTKMKPMAGTPEMVGTEGHKSRAPIGEYAPVAIVVGLCGLAVAIAAHSAKQQFQHHPGVNVMKRRRESLVEADEPEKAIMEADKFITKSFLRKVAHIKENKDPIIPNPIRGAVQPSKTKAETLKSIGVE